MSSQRMRIVSLVYVNIVEQFSAMDPNDIWTKIQHKNESNVGSDNVSKDQHNEIFKRPHI